MVVIGLLNVLIMPQTSKKFSGRGAGGSCHIERIVFFPQFEV